MNRDKNQALGKRATPETHSELNEPSNVQKKTKYWWEKDDIMNDTKKWDYLEHNGVLFPSVYSPKGLHIIYKGEKVLLTPEQEEISIYWCQSLGSDYENHPIFKKNVATLFESIFKGKVSLQDINFSPIIKHLEAQKEEKKKERELKKNWSKEQKEQEKIAKELKDQSYGFAIIDGRLEKIGGYMIEPPSLFRGRGNHPKNGLLKERVFPEDVELNLSKDAPIPKCPIPGRAWGGLRYQDDVTWLATYRDDVITNSSKYIFLAANSTFKGISDYKKYEKARGLKTQIDRIRQDYWSKIESKNKEDQQIGVVTYLIDKLALRVGNDKNEENEADTVGCCSLRCEHVKLLDDDILHLNFLGKDSIEYDNKVKIDKKIYSNIAQFLKGKKAEDSLFEEVVPSKLNRYLQSLMTGLTAKVFRTYNASSILAKTLEEESITRKDDIFMKVKHYNDANAKVAVLCNHQKAVQKSFDERMEKNKTKIEDLEDYISKSKKHLKELEKGKTGLKSDKVSNSGRMKKTYSNNIKSVKQTINKLKERLEKEKIIFEEKMETKNISLGTSKINYNDPRISVSWCKKFDVPIDRVFSKELRSKFAWAMSTASDWKF